MSSDDLVNGRDFVRRRLVAPMPAPEQASQPSEPDEPRGPGVSGVAEPTRDGWAREFEETPSFPMAAPVPAPVPASVDAAVSGSPLSRSFLIEDEGDLVGAKGLRRFLGMGPPREAVREHAWRLAISRHWVGPRTVALANPKGGAGKTPSTIALGALFARLGGTGVLAWDNNVTRGSLGWRTEQSRPNPSHPGSHRRTVLDLLGVAEELMRIEARVGDVDAYVRHQCEDRFDVLASAAHLLPNQQRITEEDFDAIWRVATKYYRLILVDSGNEETAPNWIRMIDRSDVLVVPMANRRDHAEAAREMLQSLRTRDEHSARLAANAVVIVSEAIGGRAGYAAELEREFATEAREVVVVPFDPAIGADQIRYDALTTSAQRAYLRAAAAVAARLDEVTNTGVTNTGVTNLEVPHTAGWH
ncbi:MAG: ParA family protein [Acidimicrobiaceae bacterium]|nr:ParA family protein [Acidimicrobiaceae bacterium]